MMNFPTHDWQFFAATGIAILAILWLFRRFLPGAKQRKRRRGRRTSLTIEGLPVETHSTPPAIQRPDNRVM